MYTLKRLNRRKQTKYSTLLKYFVDTERLAYLTT